MRTPSTTDPQHEVKTRTSDDSRNPWDATEDDFPLGKILVCAAIVWSAIFGAGIWVGWLIWR